jgi:putative metallohydrolase (TIGR04338 family)
MDRGGPIDFFGSRLLLPVQLRFGDLDAVTDYVNGLNALHPLVDPVAVRHRRGEARAHYSDGVIAIPSDAQWACRESILLHEFAHHLVATSDTPAGNLVSAHGAYYRTVMVALVGRVQTPESALLLRSCYESNGLAVPVDVD